MRKVIADSSESTEVMIALSQPSKDAVKTLAQTAFTNGGKPYADPQDHGFMFQ